MKKNKNFKHDWHLDKGYKFEWNDLRALITVINVILVIIFGVELAWFGLAVALLGIIKDITIDKRISGIIMHLANVALNIYFLVSINI